MKIEKAESTSNEKTMSSKASTVELPPPISVSEALIVNALCVLGLAFAFWVANTVYSIELVTHPSLTLFFIWITELPIVTLLYSRYRQNRKQCTYLRAVGRGVLGVPVGALLNFLGAIAVGAPVTFQYLPKTVNWALMMSVFTVCWHCRSLWATSPKAMSDITWFPCGATIC